MPKRKAPIGSRKFLKAARLAGAAVLSVRAAKAREPTATADTRRIRPPVGAGLLAGYAGLLARESRQGMPDRRHSRASREALELEPNQTFGYVRDTYHSALYIAPGGLPDPFAPDARSVARCSSW